jgi:hemin uptake protein HemP
MSKLVTYRSSQFPPSMTEQASESHLRLEIWHGDHRKLPHDPRLARSGAMNAPFLQHGEFDRSQRARPPEHDARLLTKGGVEARIVLDGTIYVLRITRLGKLILTK